MTSRSVVAAVWIFAALPAVLSLFSLTDLDWRTPSLALDALGRLCGIAGLGFILTAASLSSRVPGFDRAFGGLTKLLKIHRALAAVGFILILFHPLLLAFSNADDLHSATATLFPARDEWAVWAGWAALLVMMVFLAPSFGFFGEVSFPVWKALHRLAGLTVVLALVHAFVLNQMIPRPWAYVLWLTLSVLALAAVAYRLLFARTQILGQGGFLSYRVSGSRKVATDVVEISLEPEGPHLRYQTGQFAYFRPYDKALKAGFGEEHPYTISSSPTEAQLRVTIKNQGDATRAIQSIAAGSLVRVEGPYGALFASDYDEDSELWIAGGIGITPFLSRARYLRDNATEVDVCLIYCVQDETRALYADELQAIAEALPGFSFHLHYFYQEGPLAWDFVATRCSNATTRGVYVCGPEALMRQTRRLMLSKGLPVRRLRTQEFRLL